MIDIHFGFVGVESANDGVENVGDLLQFTGVIHFYLGSHVARGDTIGNLGKFCQWLGDSACCQVCQ